MMKLPWYAWFKKYIWVKVRCCIFNPKFQKVCQKQNNGSAFNYRLLIVIWFAWWINHVFRPVRQIQINQKYVDLVIFWKLKVMEFLIVNPGFQHIAESVFLCLNVKILLICSLVCKSFRKTLKNPKFWLKKCIQNGLLKAKICLTGDTIRHIWHCIQMFWT